MNTTEAIAAIRRERELTPEEKLNLKEIENIRLEAKVDQQRWEIGSLKAQVRVLKEIISAAITQSDI